MNQPSRHNTEPTLPKSVRRSKHDEFTPVGDVEVPSYYPAPGYSVNEVMRALGLREVSAQELRAGLEPTAEVHSADGLGGKVWCVVE